MKKEPEKTDLSEFLNENTYIQWITHHGRELLMGFVAIVLILIIVLRMTTGYGSKAYSDYISAENNFYTVLIGAKPGSDPRATEDALESLDKLLEKHPELHARYDGILAQTLINQGKVKESITFVKESINRSTKKELPFYADFAVTTILITKQQYEKALDRAKALKNRMVANGFGDTLYAYNLIRIAMLEKQVGTPEDELTAWQELKKAESVDAKAFEQVIQLFKEGNVTLADYIEAREKTLKS